MAATLQVWLNEIEALLKRDRMSYKDYMAERSYLEGKRDAIRAVLALIGTVPR